MYLSDRREVYYDNKKIFLLKNKRSNFAQLLLK